MPTIVTSAPKSVLAEELSREVEALVADFRSRKVGVQDWEIEAALVSARHRLARADDRKRRLVAAALGMVALLAALGVALIQ